MRKDVFCKDVLTYGLNTSVMPFNLLPRHQAEV
jgi:hypothetical protein